MVRRKTYRFRHGDVIEVEESNDGRRGREGKRQKRQKLTSEQMAYNNHLNKIRKCRHRLLQYFNQGDLFVTLNYEVKCRPPDMSAALKDFQKLRRKLSAAYKKADKPLYWIRNIEQGTREAWHIHIVINDIGNTLEIIQKAWTKGGIYTERLQYSRHYKADCSALAAYLSKDANSYEKRKDGSKAKTRIKESSFGSSKNMPLPEPRVEKLVRWKKEVKARKGYYISDLYEGKNPFDGCMYRRYTLIKVQRE